MSFLFILISLLIGLNLRYSIIVGVIEALIVLIFVFIRISKKFALVSLAFVLIGVGVSFIRPSFNKSTYRSLVVEVKDNYFIASSSLEKFYVYEKEHPHEIGDILEIKGYKTDLDFVRLESDFDFKEYLNNKGVYSELHIESLKVKFSNPLKINKFKQNFLLKLDENSRSLLAGMLFSKNEDGELKDLASDLHFMRLISSSGLYLSLIYFLISRLLSIYVKKEKYRDIISLLLFVPYGFLSFPRFITLKFFFYHLFKYFNDHIFKKKLDYLTLLSLTGLFFLLIDYHYAYQDSYFLSFSIPLLTYFLNGSMPKKWKIKRRIVLLIAVSLLFIPFYLKYYSEISILSIVLQILLTPLFGIYFLLSILSLVGIPLYSAINGFSGFLLFILKGVRPFLFKIYAPNLPSWGVLIYELAYFTCLYYLSIRHKPMIKMTLIPFVVTFGLYFIPIKNVFTSSVSFINVGQGDATLIRKNNTTILIDTGGSVYKDIASDVLIPFFKKNRIYDIDLLITTHDDFDHSGAVSSLVNNFKVKRYAKDYREFPLLIDGITLTNYNVYPELWKEENDESLVIGFNLNNKSYLITGDAPKKIESQIIKDHKKFKFDVLKVGHHGSNTSSGQDFIKMVDPDIGIISCGKNNKFGHPHKATLSTLKKYDVKIRRTDLEGTIVI